MTDKKLTDSEIVNALSKVRYGGHGCKNCKYDNGKGDDRCGLKDCKIARYALDLITRQQTEIERLRKEVNLVSIQFQDLQERYEEAQSEVERLKPFEDKIAEFKSHIRVEDMLVFASSLEEWLEFCDNLKSEAVKEVFEKLNKKAEVGKIIDKNFPFIIRVVTLHDINELKKEMVDD